MKVTHPLKPIYNKDSKILILGSMPSIKSREDNFYYAHQTNRFWKIMESLFNVTLNTNEDKINFLLKNNIALWDVIMECEITASSDSSIKNIKVNNIKNLIVNSNIKVIFITGKKAYEIYTKYIKDINLEVIYLPSPSSANAIESIDELVRKYNIIKQYL